MMQPWFTKTPKPETFLGDQVTFHRTFLSKGEADELFQFCTMFPVHAKPVRMVRRQNTVRHRTCAFATKKKYATYKYTSTERPADVPMPGPIKKLCKQLRVQYPSTHFNYVCLTKYEDQPCGTEPHSDDDPGIVEHSDIAEISVGRDARIVFQRKRGRQFVDSQRLHHGSLIVMRDKCQVEYKHSICNLSNYSPVDVGLAEQADIRFSLTFRQNKEKN